MSEYIDSVLRASGGHAAPAEVLASDKEKKKPAKKYSSLSDDAPNKKDEPFEGDFDPADIDDEDDEELDLSEEDIATIAELQLLDDGSDFFDFDPMLSSGLLVPEEQDLADALLEIVEKHGKFNDDNTGVWAGYTSAEENVEKAAIGVKCGNCVFWQAPNGCKIIIAETEEGGLCRFAVLPDGSVDPSKKEKPVEEYFTKSPELIQEELKKKIKELKSSYKEEYVEISDLVPTQEVVNSFKFKDASEYDKPVDIYKQGGKMYLVDGHHRCSSRLADGISGVRAKVYYDSMAASAVEELQVGEGCPPATQDIQLNLENRQNAIDNVGYGPLNPAEPNEEFWQDKADRWNIEITDAKTAVCGNCIFFIRTPKMLDCIEEGIGLGSQEAEGSIEAGELGYCNALDFKCASERTCNAWAAGGPVTEDSEETTAAVTAAAKRRTKAQTPAPKKDRIKGSTRNRKGSAGTGKGVTFSAAIEKSLSKKSEEHNEKAPDGRKTSLRTLKAVYRRGAGAFSVSHRPGQNRNSWAMARVNAFLKLLKSGRPKNAKYTTDNDLLPASHPRSSKKSTAIIAAGDPCWDGYVQVGMKSKGGKKVPNCVPTSASIDFYADSFGGEYGESRRVDKTSTYEVARKALDKYSYLDEEELSNAILWEVSSFVEYATSGIAPQDFSAEEYSDLLPEGHPDKDSSLVASITWLAGAPELDDSSRYAVLSAFSETADYVSSLHSATRLRAMVSSGRLSSDTVERLRSLATRASKVE